MLENIIVKNPKVLEYLDHLPKLTLTDGDSFAKGWDGTDYDNICEYSTSDATIESIVKDKTTFKKYSFNILWGETEGGTYFRETVGKLLEYQRYYTSAYVPKGFVSWHADIDIAGYYLMFSYTESGKGFFKYRDPVTGLVVRFDDSPGWMVRSGKLGTEDKEVVWHCAAAEEERYTILFMYDDKETFDKAVRTLETI